MSQKAQPTTPEDLRQQGYTIHFGGKTSNGEDRTGSYWWSRKEGKSTDDGMDCFDRAEDAITSAYLQHEDEAFAYHGLCSSESHSEADLVDYVKSMWRSENRIDGAFELLKRVEAAMKTPRPTVAMRRLLPEIEALNAG